MIKLGKEKPKNTSIENQLERLYEMRTILKSSYSIVGSDYAEMQINNRIKELEQKIAENDAKASIQEDTPMFDTEVYAKKAKGE